MIEITLVTLGLELQVTISTCLHYTRLELVTLQNIVIDIVHIMNMFNLIKPLGFIYS